MNGACRKFVDHWMPSLISIAGAFVIAYFGYFEDLAKWRGKIDQRLSSVVDERTNATDSRRRLQLQIDELIKSVNQLNINLAVNSDRVRGLSDRLGGREEFR